MSEFKRSLGLVSAVSVVIGGIIGSGIFMKPSLMMSQLGSPVLLLSVWLVAGCVTMFGALSNAEAAAMFPETGGQYVFFQKMYGNGFAFLYGWASFSVINTAGNVSIAYVCAEYTNYFFELPKCSPELETYHFTIPFLGAIFPLQNIGVKSLTAAILMLLSVVNYFSLSRSAGLQRVLTSLKALAILVLVVGLFSSGKGSFQNLGTSLPTSPSGYALFAAYMAALSGAFWAYDGWNNITFVAGEIKNPQSIIPKSLFGGIVFCICTYLALNLAYIYVLPAGSIAGSGFVASSAAAVVWGTLGGSIIALLVILSTLGTVNANVLSTARVTFAMGRENKWFSGAGKIHPRFSTPGNALVVNSGWGCLLVFSGSFDILTDMLIFVSWFFYGMSALGIFILRIKYPDLHRPYKVWGYPVVTAFFVLFTFVFLCATVYTDILDYASGKAIVVNSLLGVLLTLIGIPLYFLSGRKSLVA